MARALNEKMLTEKAEQAVMLPFAVPIAVAAFYIGWPNGAWVVAAYLWGILAYGFSGAFARAFVRHLAAGKRC